MFAIENQQNRLITLEVIANRVYEEMTEWPLKKKNTFFFYFEEKRTVYKKCTRILT